MDDDALKAAIQRSIADAGFDGTAPAGVDFSMALAVYTLRALEDRMPGFRDEVRAKAVRSAEKMAELDEPDAAERAASIRELADSWVFTD